MPASPTEPQEPASSAPQPDLKAEEARPSDAEIAHQPNEGPAQRDARLQSPEARDRYADQNRGALDGHPSKDLGDEARTGERLGERGHRLGG